MAGLLSVGLIIGIVYDRRPPLEYIAGEVIPERPHPGQDITARWTANWSRLCEAVVSREIVGSDLIVRPYLKFNLRIPTRLGIQTRDAPFALGDTLPLGLTAYHATLRFHDCGLTSWLWPITLNQPPLYFQVGR